MIRFLQLAMLTIMPLVALPQATRYTLVQPAAAGEITYAPSGGFAYSHHTSYSMNIRSITAKWDLRILMGEPVVDGVFKWTAGNGTPADYLDYRDGVLLECTPKKSVGYLVYIKLTPTVPKSGEGYGFNTPGSPAWGSLFCTRDGQPMDTKVPGFGINAAKEIWKNGFYVSGVVLYREGGKDGYNQAMVDASRAEYDKAKALRDQQSEKVKALQEPFTTTFRSGDTVYTNTIVPLASIHPYFSNRMVILSIENPEFTASTRSTTAALNLREGWNTFTYYIRGQGFTLRDSMRVFYQKPEVKRQEPKFELKLSRSKY